MILGRTLLIFLNQKDFAAKCIEDFIPEEKVVWVDYVRDTKLDALIDLAGFSDVLKGENKTVPERRLQKAKISFS